MLALVATAVDPGVAARLGSRPTLRFPPGVGPRVRRLALAGVTALVAQDASVAVVIVLANRYGASGALVIYGFAWAVFMVPYAVLAMPIATSAFPELSTRDGAEADGAARRRGFDVTAAASTRAVMVASWLGAAVLSARASRSPASSSHARRRPRRCSRLRSPPSRPGSIGYGLSANLSRVLYARRRNRAPALAIAGGWLLVIVADAAIVPFVPPDRVVPVLGLGTTFGLTVSGSRCSSWSAASAGPRRCAGCRGRSSPGSPAARPARRPAPRVASVVSGAVPALPAALPVQRRPVAARRGGGHRRLRRGRARLDGGDLRAALSRLRARADTVT